MSYKMKADRLAVTWEASMLFSFGTEMVGWLGAYLGGKEHLIKQLRGRDRAAVERALAICVKRGWLYDGRLQGAVLAGANWQALTLRRAALQDVDLYRANLSSTDLRNANFNSANLTLANLRNANLSYASLQATFLWGADLRGANLTGADLRGAFIDRGDLPRALETFARVHGFTLGGRRFQMDPLEWDRAFPNGTLFDENTILPDGRAWSTSVSLDECIPVHRGQ